jgi:hypothetical protein
MFESSDPGATSAGGTQARWARTGPRSSGQRMSGRDLLRRYESYRWHQARELLAMLPPEGLRSLHRRASAEDGEENDPMARLRDLVLRTLPLPPFHVWYQDVCRNPEAHLDEVWMADVPAAPSEPLALWSRVEPLRGVRWNVELAAHHAAQGWRGSLTFNRVGEVERWRTGEIFREQDVRALLDRFQELDRVSLEAFLRSVLP